MDKEGAGGTIFIHHIRATSIRERTGCFLHSLSLFAQSQPKCLLPCIRFSVWSNTSAFSPLPLLTSWQPSPCVPRPYLLLLPLAGDPVNLGPQGHEATPVYIHPVQLQAQFQVRLDVHPWADYVPLPVGADAFTPSKLYLGFQS